MSALQDTKHVYLSDILDPEQLADMIVAKRIKVQKHPELPLLVYNYTDLATYAGEWTNAERVCRGLIVAEDDMRVIARGPSKFFNYGEPHAHEYPLDTMVRVTRKEDGSLGIGWHYQGAGIATRGSFTSEQAVHGSAKMLLDAETQDNILWAAERNYTRIFEIVYPENRIVLDYAGLDANIKLGTVSNWTGRIEYRPPSSKENVITLAEAIALPIPDDEEGYVLDVLDFKGNTIDHLKLKGARYKELHAAIFGLTERKVWEQMQAGTAGVFINTLPDEVQPWAKAVRARLGQEYIEFYDEIFGAVAALEKLSDRKEQAAKVMADFKHLSGALFAALDSNYAKVRDWIYNQTKPGHAPFQSVKENA